MRGAACFLIACFAAACATAEPAPAGLQRTIVGKHEVSVSGREAVVVRIELAPGANSGRHTHPGDEITYVLEGETLLLVDGETPRTVKAGESFVVPAHRVHEARNESGRPVRAIGVYVVEKGQPLATPAR